MRLSCNWIPTRVVSPRGPLKEDLTLRCHRGQTGNTKSQLANKIKKHGSQGMEMWQAHWFSTSPPFPSLSPSLPPSHPPSSLHTCLIWSTSLCCLHSVANTFDFVLFFDLIFILHNIGKLMWIMSRESCGCYFLKCHCGLSDAVTKRFPSLKHLIVNKRAACLPSTNVMSEVFSVFKVCYWMDIISYAPLLPYPFLYFISGLLL